jgi:type I restriction enzyme S subunit
MNFPHYPEYKDSGVEWLREVPAHWAFRRTKFLFDIMSRPPSNDDEIVTCFRDGVVTLRRNRRVDGFTNSEKEIGYQGVRAGDLVIHAMDGFAGAIGVSDSDGKSTPVYSVCRPRSGEVCAHYYGRLLRQMALGGFVASLAKGIRERSTEFRWKDAGDLVLPLPPRIEQDAISRFIEHETAKIDALVAEQEKLIALLKEKRQAVISRAVTKGLNPDAPMKDSGIEWLGEVPAHWEVQRVKSVSSFTTSGPRGWSDRISEEGPLFVQSGDLNDDLKVEFAESKRVHVENDAETARTLLRNGDVVVCITGAKTGNVAVCPNVPEPAYVNQHLCLIRPTPEIEPTFLGVLLKSSLGQTYFDLSQYGLKQGLSLEDVNEAPVLVPPLAEQSAVVRYVLAESTRFKSLTIEAQRAIDLLKERRSALISAAVTGKIDVREFA